MPVSSQKIVAPVSIADVQQVLGLGSNYSNVEAVCKAPNINMWAKFKPVRSTDKFYTSQWDYTNNKWKSDATWWKSGSYQMIGSINPYFAMFQFTAANFAALRNKYDGGLNGWTYYAPNSVYRLMDFAGYNHNAAKPVQNFTMNSQISQTGRLFAQIMLNYDGSGTADCITLGDFSSTTFGGLYFGILVCQGNEAKLIATDTTANGGTVDRTFEGSGNILPLGSYTAYPILINKNLFTTSLTRTEETAVVCTCPNVSPINFDIVSPSTLIDVEISFTPILTSSYTGTFQVINGESAQITNLEYVFTTSSTQPASTASWANWRDSSSAVSVAANSESTLMTKTFTGYSYIHIRFRKSGGTYYKWKRVDTITPPSPQT